MCHCPSTDSPGSSLFCDYGFIGCYVLSHPSEPRFTCWCIAVSQPQWLLPNQPEAIIGTSRLPYMRASERLREIVRVLSAQTLIRSSPLIRKRNIAKWGGPGELEQENTFRMHLGQVKPESKWGLICLMERKRNWGARGHASASLRVWKVK